MSAAYAAWEDECDREDRRLGQGKYSSSPFRPSSELAAHGRLPTYRRLESMFMELPDSERTALLALGWFTVDRVADWPRVYERARATARNPDYEIGYGHLWLQGLERWEATPKPFEAGGGTDRIGLDVLVTCHHFALVRLSELQDAESAVANHRAGPVAVAGDRGHGSDGWTEVGHDGNLGRCRPRRDRGIRRRRARRVSDDQPRNGLVGERGGDVGTRALEAARHRDQRTDVVVRRTRRRTRR